MKKLMDFIDTLNKKFFSSTQQLTRIVILIGIVLVLAVGTFAGYYWYDRYYQPQPKLQEVSISKAEQAVRDNPADIEARISLANAYMIGKRWNDAISQIEEAKKVKPDDVRLDFLLGVTYANTSRCVEAVPLLQKYTDSLKDAAMLNLNTNYQAALYYEGDCYLALNQPDKALPPLVDDANLSQTDSDVLYKLGLAYQGVGNSTAALVAFQKAVSFVPDYTEVYTAMVAAYNTLGKPNQAKYARAMVGYSQKDYATANTLLQQVTKDEPTFEPAFAGLGLICEAQENMQCALAAYTTASKLDENDFTASQGVARVTASLKK